MTMRVYRNRVTQQTVRIVATMDHTAKNRVERRRIALAEPIKEAGDHVIPVKLHRDLSAELKVTVTAED